MQKDILKFLKKAGVLQTGHFLLPSGKHSDVYFQFSKLLQYPDKSMKFLEIAVKMIKDSNLVFDTILGPAIGGILISYELARQLDKPMIYTEKQDGTMFLAKGFEIKKGQKILIAEDVITSGKTVNESINLIESLGGIVVGIVCIVNKESISISKNIYSCISLNLKSYYMHECPLCKEKLPLRSGK